MQIELAPPLPSLSSQSQFLDRVGMRLIKKVRGEAKQPFSSPATNGALSDCLFLELAGQLSPLIPLSLKHIAFRFVWLIRAVRWIRRQECEYLRGVLS